MVRIIRTFGIFKKMKIHIIFKNMEEIIINQIKRKVKTSFELIENNFIKFRYEYKKNDKIKNIFIYTNNFYEFIKIYENIPNEYKHFYEIINEECKFFLDLDAKIEEIDPYTWKRNISIIKKELILFFNEIFNKEIKILEYKSFPLPDEPKYSCHLIIQDYKIKSEDCKIVCNMFLNYLKNKSLNSLSNIIDDKVYGKNRMLRIEGSTKIGSNRIKKCIYNNIIDIPNEIINTKGLITNLENTILININKENILKNILNHKENKIKDFVKNYEITFENKNDKYNYTNDDIIYLKNNIDYIIDIINSWHYKIININKDINKEDYIFDILKIENNRIDLKRIKSFDCPICKRIHEKQNSYIFIKNMKLMFHCRRTDNKPIKVCDL